MTTFQEQCMKVVFPKLIEGINAANRKAENAVAKSGALASEVAQLQAKAAELEVQLADAIDRVNMLEARVPEKKARKPRAKKQADPVQMVEQAAQEAQAPVVETVEQAMNELPF